jgi:hypothetical protein
MSDRNRDARPSQVTMAGWVAVIASVLLVLTLFEAVGRLHTVQFRDQVEEFLSTPPGSGLGLEFPQIVEILRVLMLFSGAAAAAATVLAVYVLQRHNAARIGFTVAAVVLMLTAPVAGGFLPVMIGFAALLLWSRPARDWFAGRPVRQTGAFAQRPRNPGGRRDDRPDCTGAPDDRADNRVEGMTVSGQDDPNRPGERPEDAPAQGAPTWPRMPGDDQDDQDDRSQPPPTQGYGSPDEQRAPQGGSGGYPPQYGHQPGPYGPPPQGPQGRPDQHYARPPYGYPPQGGPYAPPPYGQPPYAQPPYGQPPYAQAPYGYPGYGQGAPSYSGRQADPERRPATVTAAAWVTWVLSGLVMLTFLMLALVMVAARDQFLRQLQEDANFQALDLPTGQVVAAMWAMGAIALFWCISAMVLAWFAFRRANWARITLVVSSAMTLLVSIAAFPVGLLHVLGAGAVIALLFLGGANEWFGSSGQGHPAAFQSPGSGVPAYGERHDAPRGPAERGPHRDPDRDPGRDPDRDPDRDEEQRPPNVW